MASKKYYAIRRGKKVGIFESWDEYKKYVQRLFMKRLLKVADLLGISQSYISRLEKKIINRLKKEISRMI